MQIIWKANLILETEVLLIAAAPTGFKNSCRWLLNISFAVLVIAAGVTFRFLIWWLVLWCISPGHAAIIIHAPSPVIKPIRENWKEDLTVWRCKASIDFLTLICAAVVKGFSCWRFATLPLTAWTSGGKVGLTFTADGPLCTAGRTDLRSLRRQSLAAVRNY